MINNIDVGTVIDITEEALDTLYLVRNGNIPNADLLLFSTDGVPLLDDTIQTRRSASLFFDSDDNYYCANISGFIAQYNFETKELDELSGQSLPAWTKIFVSRLDGGDFMTSQIKYNPDIFANSIYTQRYSIDGTLQEEIAMEIYGWFGDPELLEAFSTDGTTTTISFAGNTLKGVGSFTASGLLWKIVVSSQLQSETGGTIHGDTFYTMNGNLMFIRDLETNEIIEEIPITNINVGSIGVQPSSGPGRSIRGLLTSFESINTVTSTIANSEGEPVLFQVPGRKAIEITTKQNLDDFIDIKNTPVIVKDEQYEVVSIKCVTDKYTISLQTPQETQPI